MPQSESTPKHLSPRDYNCFMFCDGSLDRELKRCQPEEAMKVYLIMYQKAAWWTWTLEDWADYRATLETLKTQGEPEPHPHAWILNEMALFIEYFGDSEHQLLDEKRRVKLASSLESCYHRYVRHGREIPEHTQVTYAQIKHSL